VTHTVSKRPSDGFRLDIEGLRGIAVLLVVLYHSHVPFITGGYIGVDVFFVISGYLITGLLVKEAEASGSISLSKFYARRARRLLPAAALTLTATIVAGFFIYAPSEQRQLAKTCIATALYCSNIDFARRATEYLAADAAINPFLHTWSLAVEEQFYLVWPILILLATRYFRSDKHRRLCLLLGLVAALSFAANIWLTNGAQPWAFFSSPARAWEFALGGIAQFGSRRSYSRVFVAAPVLGLLAILACATLFSSATHFPGAAALVPVLGAAAMLHFCYQQDGVNWLLANPVTQLLGRLSYTWYLWHWPALVLASAVWKLTVADRLLCSILTLGLAAVTHRFFENPIRFHPALLFRPRLSLGLAGCLTFAGVGISVLFLLNAMHLERTPGQFKFSYAISDWPKTYEDGCHLSYADIDSPSCEFGDTQSNTSIVLFGDSHAGQWFPALERIALDKRWKLLAFTKSACPAASIQLYDSRLKRDYTECYEWRDRTIQRIIALHPAAVLLGDFAGQYIKGQRMSAGQWGDGLRETISRFSRAGLRTLVIHDPPSPNSDVAVCLARTAWNHTNTGSCRFARDDTWSAPVALIEANIARSFCQVYVTDLSRKICPGQTCNVVQNGNALYRDQGHLTVHFVLTLAPFLGQEVERVMYAPHQPRCETDRGGSEHTHPS
jgi:peptidoglycan/LPS O-acetylase OafA/YrhL